jgi:hypothetical protein
MLTLAAVGCHPIGRPAKILEKHWNDYAAQCMRMHCHSGRPTELLCDTLSCLACLEYAVWAPIQLGRVADLL